MKPGLVVLTAGLALAASTLAACAGPAAELVDPVVVDALEVALSPVPFAMLAYQQVITDCVREGGFPDYPGAPGLSQTGSSAGATLLGVAGVWGSIEEASSGYDTSLSTAGDEQLVAWQNALSDDQQADFDKVMKGDSASVSTYVTPAGIEMSTPADGCIGAANTAIYGSGEQYLEFSNIMNVTREPLAPEKVSSYPAAVQAMAKYSSCMNEAGYVVDGLSATRRLAEERFGGSRPAGSTPTTDELEMAVTDAQCQQSADVKVSFDAAYTELASSWINDNEGLIIRAAEIRQETGERVKAVMEG